MEEIYLGVFSAHFRRGCTHVGGMSSIFGYRSFGNILKMFCVGDFHPLLRCVIPSLPFSDPERKDQHPQCL